MRVIGLDLSLTGTGIATNYGTATIHSKARGMERLAHIRDQVLSVLIPDVEHLFVIEGYSMGTARQSSHAHGLGELGGVIRLALWEAGVGYLDCPPACLKRYACGRGNAPKEEVLIAAVKRGADVRDNNQADAFFLRAMGLDAMGAPVVDMPQAHRAGLKSIEWSTPVICTRGSIKPGTPRNPKEAAHGG